MYLPNNSFLSSAYKHFLKNISGYCLFESTRIESMHSNHHLLVL